MFSCSHKFNIYLQQKSFNKRYIIASKRRERPWTTHGGILPQSLDILGGLALCLLSGLLLLLPSLLLPFSIDISRQCLIVSQLKLICFLTFESENKCIHLVIILKNWNLELFIWAHLFDVELFIVVARGGRGGVIRWSLLQACQRRRSHHPHLDNRVIGWSLLLVQGRRSGAAARTFHLLVRGRRNGAARGRSEPFIAVSSLLLHELRMLANHG
jgi:hypothetical protein